MENKNNSVDISQSTSFDILLNATLKGITKNSYGSQVHMLMEKPKIVDLIKSFQPQDSVELLLVLQFLVGHLWSMEKLQYDYKFESFMNLSFRACDFLVRYKSMKIKKALKNDIPHEDIEIHAEA